MPQGRTKKGIVNIAYNLLNQIIMLVLAFVSRSVFIHYLGTEYLGINGLFSDVLNLLSMADLGFNTAMVYSFYKPLAENDYRKMAALTSFYKKVYNVIASVVAIAGLVMTPFLKYIVKLDQPIDHLYLYYWLSLANIVVSYLCVYKTSILTADQKNYLVVRITMVFNIIKTAVQIFSLVLWQNYMVYLVIAAVGSLLSNVITSEKASAEYPFINQKAELDKAEKKNIFVNVGSSFIYKVSSVLITSTDNLLMSLMFGTITVGYYSNYLLIQTKITSFFSLLFTSLIAGIGSLIVKEDAEKRYEIFECEQMVGNILSMVVVPCYVALADEFICIWLGKNFVMDTSMVLAIGTNLYLSCVLQPLWSYREATGLYRKTKWVMAVCAGLNLILSVALGLLIGVSGIIWASSLSRLLTYVWYEPKVLFKDFFALGPGKFFFSLLKNACYVAGLVVLSFLFKRKDPTILYWIVKAAAFGVICLLTAFGVYGRSRGMKLLKEKLADVLKKFRCRNGSHG